MLKYQACLAFQHWDIRTFLGGGMFRPIEYPPNGGTRNFV